MNGEHTPGPWRRGSDRPRSLELLTEVYAQNGFCVAKANASHDGRRPTADEVMGAVANARLIAAAPDLLAALRLIADAEPSKRDLDYCRGIARAVIRKATGEAA